MEVYGGNPSGAENSEPSEFEGFTVNSEIHLRKTSATILDQIWSKLY